MRFRRKKLGFGSFYSASSSEGAESGEKEIAEHEKCLVFLVFTVILNKIRVFIKLFQQTTFSLKVVFKLKK